MGMYAAPNLTMHGTLRAVEGWMRQRQVYDLKNLGIQASMSRRRFYTVLRTPSSHGMQIHLSISEHEQLPKMLSVSGAG